MHDEWKRALGTMAYGIYVLTTAHRDRVNGMIASWASQISYEPPMICVAVHPNRLSHELINQSGCFALNALGQDQKDLVTRFMKPEPAVKFGDISYSKGRTGCPLLESCVAFFECELRETYRPGNHTLFIGEIVQAAVASGGAPLTTLDYRGQYIGKV
jgi:flavin reductase (DIM6/NTAB) family NADH-FMN oxidoreductase RutF